MHHDEDGGSAGYKKILRGKNKINGDHTMAPGRVRMPAIDLENDTITGTGDSRRCGLGKKKLGPLLAWVWKGW